VADHSPDKDELDGPVAENVSHKTLRRLIADGKLPAYRVGGGPIRVLISDVAALKEPIRPHKAS